jgi:hypothetical protein
LIRLSAQPPGLCNFCKRHHAEARRTRKTQSCCSKSYRLLPVPSQLPKIKKSMKANTPLSNHHPPPRLSLSTSNHCLPFRHGTSTETIADGRRFPS